MADERSLLDDAFNKIQRDMRSDEANVASDQILQDNRSYTVEHPYNMGRLVDLGSTVLEVDELTAKFIRPALQQRRAFLKSEEGQNYQRYDEVTGEKKRVHLWDIAGEFAHKSSLRGNKAGALLWEEIALAEYRRNGLAHDRYKEKAYDALPWYDKAMSLTAEAGLSYMNARLGGIVEPAAEGLWGTLGGAVKALGVEGIADTPAGRIKRYRKNRAEVSGAARAIGSFGEGWNMSIGSLAAETAGLWGLSQGAGGLMRKGNQGLMRSAHLSGLPKKLNTGAYMFLTGARPSVARRAMAEAGEAATKSLGKVTVADKVAEGLWSMASSAQNFGMYEASRALFDGLHRATLPATQAELDEGGEAGTFGKRMAQLGPDMIHGYFGGAAVGAVMPWLGKGGHKAGDVLEQGAALGMNMGKLGFKGATVKSLYRTHGLKGAARGVGSSILATPIAGSIEFLGLGLLPSLDKEDGLDWTMLKDLVGGDSDKAGLAWKALLGQMLQGAVLKGFGIRRMLKKGPMGRGELRQTGTVQDQIDWRRYWIEGKGKENVFPALPAGKVHETNADRSHMAEIAAQIARGERSIDSFPVATERQLIDMVKAQADMWDTGSPALREILIYDALDMLKAKGLIETEKLKKEAKDQGRPEQEVVADWVFGELAERMREQADLELLKDDAAGKMDKAVDEYELARQNMLPGMVEGDAELGRIQNQITAMEKLQDAIGEEMAKQGESPIGPQLDALRKAYGQRQLKLFADGESPLADFADKAEALKQATKAYMQEQNAKYEKAQRAGMKASEQAEKAKKAGINEADAELLRDLFGPLGGKKAKGKKAKKAKGKTPAPAAGGPEQDVVKELLAQKKQERVAEQAAAKERADDAEAAILDSGKGTDKESVSRIFADRAIQDRNNPKAAEAWLNAQKVLERVSNALVRKAGEHRGIQGIRGLGAGMSEAKARLVMQMMGIVRKPKGATPKAPGQKPKEGVAVSTPALIIAKAFQFAGRPLEAGTEARTLRAFEGRDVATALLRLKEMGVPKDQRAQLLKTIVEQIDLAQPGTSAAEEAANVAAEVPRVADPTAPQAEIEAHKAETEKWRKEAKERGDKDTDPAFDDLTPVGNYTTLGGSQMNEALRAAAKTGKAPEAWMVERIAAVDAELAGRDTDQKGTYYRDINDRTGRGEVNLKLADELYKTGTVVTEPGYLSVSNKPEGFRQAFWEGRGVYGVERESGPRVVMEILDGKMVDVQKDALEAVPPKVADPLDPSKQIDNPLLKEFSAEGEYLGERGKTLWIKDRLTEVGPQGQKQVRIIAVEVPKGFKPPTQAEGTVPTRAEAEGVEPQTATINRAATVQKWQRFRTLAKNHADERSIKNPGQWAEHAGEMARRLGIAAQQSGGEKQVQLARAETAALAAKRYYEGISLRRLMAREALLKAGHDPKGDGDTVLEGTGLDLPARAQRALEDFNKRTNDELITDLEAIAQDYPGLAGNLDFIREGLERGKTHLQNPERAQMVPYSATFGDRIVIQTPYGPKTGVVVTKPAFGTKRTDAPGRRVKLFDGHTIKSIRLSDIVEWSPETHQDLDFSTGKDASGQVRNGKEVTGAQLAALMTPPPRGFGREPIYNPKMDVTRERLLTENTGTLVEAKQQAQTRAKRARKTRGDEAAMRPEDHRLEANGWLAPREARKMFFIPYGTQGEGQRGATEGERSRGAAMTALAKALNLREKGKKLSERDLELIQRARGDELLWTAVNQFAQPYYEPGTKLRTIDGMREELRKATDKETSDALYDDIGMWETAMGRADASSAARREAKSWRAQRQQGSVLVSLGESSDNTLAMLRRMSWNDTQGKWVSGGAKEFLIAEYQQDTGTWLVREQTRADAWATAQKHFGGDSFEKIGRWATDRMKFAAATAGEGRQIVNAKDRTMLLKEVLNEGTDMLLRYGMGVDVVEAKRGTSFNIEGERERTFEPQDNHARMVEVFGKGIMGELDRWLKEHPRPDLADQRGAAAWDIMYNAYIMTGIGKRMNTLVGQGRDPITGRKMEQLKTGEWRVEDPKGGYNPRKLGLFPYIPEHTGRNLVGMGKGVKTGIEAAYGLLQGGLADTTHGAFSALMTQPLAKLSRSVIAMKTGGTDSADVILGWSDNANYMASRHNEHLARVDLWTHRADTLARGMAKKYTRQQLIDILKAEHEGKKPPQLAEFRKLMEEAASAAKEVGLAGNTFDEKWGGRYVRMGRWKWQDLKRLAGSIKEAELRFDEVTDSLRAHQKHIAALDPTDVSDQEIGAGARLQSEAVEMQRRLADMKRQRRRLKARFIVPWGNLNRSHGTPLDVFDVKAVRDWETHDRRRKVTDWDKAVERGLDLDRPELLLWDSIVHHFHGIEQARFIKEIANDPRMSQDFKEAPEDWVVIDKDEVRANRAYRHLLGRKVSPWIYHFMKMQEGPNGALEKIHNDMTGTMKMSLTAVAPANWALQVIANPLQIGAVTGVSVFKSYASYSKALVQVMNPMKQKQLQKEFGKLRWLDVASDWDREYMQMMRNDNPHINTDNIQNIINSTVEAFGRGEVRAGIGGLGKAVMHGPTRALQGIAWMYRRLDGAARISTYRILRDQGSSHEAAVQKVNQGWDLFHQNKTGDAIRKGVVRFGKYGVPMPILANSFNSVPWTFMRNFAQIAGKTPLQMAEMAVMVGVWNNAVQSWNGLDDEEVQRRIANMHPEDNSVIHWLRSKLTPLTPNGEQGIDIWGYTPLGAALEAIPGGEAAFFGGIEGALETGTIAGTLKGIFEGKDAWGADVGQAVAHRLTGGGHVLMSPFIQYMLDRDEEGRSVQYRYEGPGLGGTTGWKRMALENGVASIAGVLAISSLIGAGKQHATEVAAVAGFATRVRGVIDKTGAGLHPSIEMIADGEDIFDAPVRSWQDAIMRTLGLKVRNPDAVKRYFERVGRDERIQITDMGQFEADKSLVGAQLLEARKIAADANMWKRARSGAILWGTLRHMQTLPIGSEKWVNMKAELERRWTTPDSRRHAAMALVRIERGKEAKEAMGLLRDFGLLVLKEGQEKLRKTKPAELAGKLKREP